LQQTFDAKLFGALVVKPVAAPAELACLQLFVMTNPFVTVAIVDG
jgi:hypothetical protein